VRAVFPLTYPALGLRPSGALVGSIDQSHPLAQGLLGYWLLPQKGLFGTELVTGQAFTYLGATVPTQTDTPYGTAMKMNANGTTSTNFWDLSQMTNQNRYTPQLPVSIFVLGLFDVSTFQTVFCNDNGANSAALSGIGLYQQTNKILALFGDGVFSSFRQKQTASLGMNATTFYALACSMRAATDMSLYLNGIDQGGSYSGSGGALAYGGTHVGIGMPNFNFNSSSNSTNAVVLLCCLWNRSLSDAEHLQMALDPYHVVARQRLDIGAILAQSTTAPFVAASTTVYTPSYTLAFFGALPFVAASTTVYAPNLRLLLPAPFVSAATTVYTPGYTLLYHLSGPFIAAATTIHAPTLSSSGIGTLLGQSAGIGAG
jgi:hypothetical protein